MSKETIGKTRILTELRAVVAEFGEGTRRTCFYELDGCPRCIAGVVFSRLGVPLKTLRSWEGNYVDDLDEAGQLNEYGDFTENAVKVLSRAQASQDDNLSWGEALSDAEILATKLDGE